MYILEITSNQYLGLKLMMLAFILIGIISLIIPLFIKKKNKTIEGSTSLDLSEEYLKKVDDTIDKEQLKKEIFDLYKKMEVAKSKFNYDKLKELLVDSLYKEEEQKLNQLKSNKEKIVATNIRLQEIKILSIIKQKELENITAYLHVSQYDYVTNNKKKVIRGTDESEYQIEYKITLEKGTDKYFKIKKIDCTGKWIKNL